MATRAGDKDKKSGGSSTSKSVTPQDDACECRSGPVAGSAIVHGVTFSNKWLHYAEVDGKAMFEGDIVLGSIFSHDGHFTLSMDSEPRNLPPSRNST